MKGGNNHIEYLFIVNWYRLCRSGYENRTEQATVDDQLNTFFNYFPKPGSQSNGGWSSTYVDPCEN
jgi:hypothetical protein